MRLDYRTILALSLLLLVSTAPWSLGADHPQEKQKQKAAPNRADSSGQHSTRPKSTPALPNASSSAKRSSKSAEREADRALNELLRRYQEERPSNNYSMMMIKPDPNVDYKIIKIKPDPNVDHKMLIHDPYGRDHSQVFAPATRPPK